jgi:hypothetical protein
MKCVPGLAVAVMLAVACGDDTPEPSCRSVPDFIVDISSVAGRLPENTVVSVTFGGGSVEVYSPAVPHDPVVLFCTPNRGPLGAGGAGGDAGAGAAPVAPAPMAGMAGTGSGGIDGSAGSGSGGRGEHIVIRSIRCELWTGGPATLEVKARDWDEKLDLEREPKLCTTPEVMVLGDEVPKD